MSRVLITDRVKNPDIERKILGESVSTDFDSAAEILLVWRQKADRQYIEKFPNLRAIIRYGIGYERVDLSYAKKKKIMVCNNPDYCLEEVSNSSIAMIMNVARGVTRLNSISKKFKVGSWQENKVSCSYRLSETVLGIIGAGNIGSRVVKKALALGFKVQFFDPYLSKKEVNRLKRLGAYQVKNQKELLGSSDIISIHVPITHETKFMVNDDFLSQIKNGASLVNTARGQLVKDVDIFIPYLKSNNIASLSLDVLPEEPPLHSDLLSAWRSNEVWLEGRVIINPHKAYYSLESAIEMRQKVAWNALRILNNKKPNYLLTDHFEGHDYDKKNSHSWSEIA